IALTTARTGKKVYMLGDIVHNETVVKKIEASGIKKINRLNRTKSGILLIRAHGASLETFVKAKQLGYEIIDATCPMVKEIHKIAKGAQAKGCKVIIIGDKEHDEVHGIAGQLKGKALIIDGISNIPRSKLKRIKKAAVVAQSTQNLKKVLEIVDILRENIPDLLFFNTICKPTRTKQEEIMTMPKENDVMIIIGSKKSANTKRLYEIARSLNKNSWWVNSRREIKSGWFKGADSVGITAGASTPEETIQDIARHIRSL
ncbi:MAG: 4-hydroxy-3-methylbut-2-enyl diphosphate reductase, partial [Candidatus Omnitrophica bacterium]|nr:4-hydroxy-3-methylbut-2-enyl diphosphate reductase [Candidatus Omnitrophota bacterium]